MHWGYEHIRTLQPRGEESNIFFCFFCLAIFWQSSCGDVNVMILIIVQEWERVESTIGRGCELIHF